LKKNNVEISNLIEKLLYRSPIIMKVAKIKTSKVIRVYGLYEYAACITDLLGGLHNLDLYAFFTNLLGIALIHCVT